MHAELCPVCQGSGRKKTIKDWSNVEDWMTCNGCGGLGWVEVKDKETKDYQSTFLIPTTDTQSYQPKIKLVRSPFDTGIYFEKQGTWGVNKDELL